MKLIIAGGRNYRLTLTDRDKLDVLSREIRIDEVVSGHAFGADRDGEAWADSKEIPVVRFDADWVKYKRGAGPIRNSEMAGYADALVAFQGGKGTNDMVKKAKAAGLKIYDWRTVKVNP